MSVLASDDFNRADDTSNVFLGANWTVSIGGNHLRIVGNAADFNTTIHAGNYYNAITWPNDHYSKGVIGTSATTNDQGLGPSVRMTNNVNGNAYLFQPNTSRSRLFKCVNGTFTQLGSDSSSFASSDTPQLDAVGTAITAKKNGSSVIGPITDSAISSGNSGLWAYGTATMDSWEGGDFAAAAGGPPDLAPRNSQFLPLLAQ